MTIRLIARRDFSFTRPYGGGVLRCTAGETFEVSPMEAVLLRVRKDADFAPAPAAAVPAPAVAPKPRRRYLRRDLTAEDRCNSSD